MRKAPWIFLALILLLGLVPGAALAKDNWSIEGAGNITSLSVSEDGSRVAVGGHNAKAFLYDSEGNPIYQVEAGNVVTGVALLSNGTLLVSSDDRHLYAYDEKGGKLWDSDLKRQVKSLAASQDGSAIVLVTQRSKDLIVVDQNSGKQTGSVPIGSLLKEVSVSANGQWIVAATSDQFAYLLDKDGSVLYKFSADNQIQAVAVSENGLAAVGTASNKVELFDQKGSTYGSINTRDIVTDVAFSNDGERLGVSDLSGNYYIFDGHGKQLWESKITGEGRGVQFDREGKTLYSGTNDGRIFKYDVGSVIDKAASKARLNAILWSAAGVLAVVLILLYLNYLKKRSRLGIFRQIWKSKYIYLGLAPTFILVFVFLYYPAVSGLFHSLYDWQPGGRTTFVGLANFERMIHDPYVIKGMGNLLILIITGLIKAIIPALITAELIFHLRSKRLQYGFRTAFTASMVIPGVALLLIWQNLYDPNVGLINNVLELIGLGSWGHGWLGDPNTALWAIIFIGFPFIGILQLLVFYAGLLSIPNELIESAKIDGANLWRIIRSIHLPLLSGQFKFLIILTLIGIIQDFNGIMIVTGGGPMDSTYVPALQMYYAATKFNDLGYASALGVSMFLVILAITVVNMKLIKTED
ncbi:ABC-type sugar transport system permease subunit/WD40 repeat protein [Paenibacillus rhizosphaerae]|uniref:ABC-type sugar transport system permease subunit/WD40 repeat protein n=1 Tax=Paenibacillus rhizosphaerae TaxID=297318 RepID=A0A839TIE4_9BACL|nr:DUF5711 family protein [Paenibacillus rhizosphaerae]MBB3125530.1 ABC-type sugar transport system permease subunit/WD40 repeat protein [Paenibacillus rhizosphaerae]